MKWNKMNLKKTRIEKGKNTRERRERKGEKQRAAGKESWAQ